MANLPSGTVTFLFSDIEGSTTLLKQLGDAAYAELLAQHRRLMRDTFAGYEGQEIDTQGDAFFYSFPRARQAVAAAVDVQRAHARAKWPQDAKVRVRIGLHTGEPAVGDEGYTGLDVVRAARIAAVGQGGQILLSDATRALVGTDLPDGVELHSLGEQRLKDIDRPEPLHELVLAELGSPAAAPAAGATAPPSAPPAPSVLDAMPAWVRDVAAPFASVGDQAREMIERRVLAEISRSLEEESGDSAPPTPPGGSMSDEIARLRDLRDSGALTEEQYARAVDRVLGSH